MHIDFSDDMRQAFVITRNEIKKFMSGKKIFLFGILLTLVIVLNAAMPYLLGGGYDYPIEVAKNFLGMIDLLIILAAVMFAATTIVSEYEERTVLILLTRPVRKWVIFIGKLIASFAIVSVFMAIMYVFTAVYSVAVTGSVVGEIGTSFGLCLCAVFGVCGFAMLLSTIAKKSSTASIMTLVLLILVLAIIGSLLQEQGIDTSWLLISAMGSIYRVLSGIPIDSLVYDAGVMIGWGVVCTAVGLILFKKRDL
ncbi:MAG: ABC transporter permease [archaeon]|nr:ABC transporter permease [archaeon]